MKKNKILAPLIILLVVVAIVAALCLLVYAFYDDIQVNDDGGALISPNGARIILAIPALQKISENIPLGSDPITALHYHNMLEIGVCASGEGYTYIDDRVYKHKAGCISISRAYQPHLSTNQKDAHGEWSWISIDTQALLTSVGMTDPEAALKLMRAAESVTGVFLPEEIKTVKDAVNRLLNAV